MFLLLEILENPKKPSVVFGFSMALIEQSKKAQCFVLFFNKNPETSKNNIVFFGIFEIFQNQKPRK